MKKETKALCNEITSLIFDSTILHGRLLSHLERAIEAMLKEHNLRRVNFSKKSGVYLRYHVEACFLYHSSHATVRLRIYNPYTKKTKTDYTMGDVNGKWYAVYYEIGRMLYPDLFDA